MKKVKLFGLRRTGTNYLTKLLNLNYEIKMIGGLAGWKHGKYRVVEMIGYELDCIVISKNIYSYLTSLERRYGGCDFYKIEEIADLIERYHLAYGDWLDIPKKLKAKKCCFVKYEDLIENPPLVCERISKELGIKRKTKDFVDIKKIVKPREIIGTKDFDKNYYLDRKYMSEYDEELRILIKKLLHVNIIEALGYSKDTLI